MARHGDAETSYLARPVRRRQGGVSGISNEGKIRKAIDSIPSGYVSTYKKIGQQVYGHARAAQTVEQGRPTVTEGLSRTRTN